MIQRTQNILSGNKKYITILVIIVALLLLSGILSPLYIQKAGRDWPADLAFQVKEVEGRATDLLNQKQHILIRNTAQLKAEISAILNPVSFQSKLITKINDKEYSGLSIAVCDSQNNLIGWTKELAVPPEKMLSISFKPGEVFFYRSNLVTYLSLIDTINTKRGTYYLSCNLPVEIHYTADTEYFVSISLKKELQEKFFTEFEVDYSPSALKTRDGRKFPVEILNNFKNVIGVITFNKPSLDTKINSIQEHTETLQALLAIAAFLCISFYFIHEVKTLKKAILKLLVTFLLLTALRYLLYFLALPTRLIEGELTSSSYFASSFGFGIVSSPVELFVSVVLLMIFCLIVFRDLSEYSKNSTIRKINNLYIYIPVFLLGVFLLLAGYRGLGASIRSVIFDSSLRYFKDPDLLPGIPEALMQLNILLLGVCVIFISVAIIILLINYLPYINKNGNNFKVFSILFIVVQVCGFIYDATQAQPQGTAVIRIIFLSLVLFLSYKIILEDYRNIFNYLYFVVIASIISVSLLNYYNTKIERESLKTTALEITRPSESLLTFLINEALSNSLYTQELYPALKGKDVNYQAVSFIVWNRSILQRERLRSSIAILDKQKNLLGSFGIDLPQSLRVNPAALTDDISDLKVYDNYEPEGQSGQIISGIIPVKEEEVTLGYIAAAILYNPADYNLYNFPPFLSGINNSLNNTVDFSNLKIFDFVDGTISNIYGEINPSGATIQQIFNSDFNENNEAWINLNINNEDYSTYLLKIREQNSERIIAVMLKEKNLSWNFYNFLKIFFIHSIFIFVLFILLFGIDLYRTQRFKFSFRTQLLVAFLIISLLPLIFLAFYNRNLTETKNQESTLYKLRKRTVILKDYINRYSNNIFTSANVYTNEKQLFDKASADLDINFTLYSGISKKYSSRNEYYEAGIIPQVLNPLIYERLTLQSYKEYIIPEKIDGYPYSSFYTTFDTGNNKYIIKVNDVFNRIEYPMSGTEVDVLLFGSYSFAMILIIILSAIFANRISYPIRRLTKATESVAGGDLNFEIETHQKSEVGDLIQGFNYMIRQLKKSQSELAEMEREIAWKEMARQVAHEIKNPLTPMKLAIQQLVIAYKDKSPKFDSIFDKVSKTMISQIDTLNNIASEFSSFARMPKLKVEEVNINVVIEDALNLFVEEKIEIVFNKNSDNMYIEADKDQLKRTIINLIRNSIQAFADNVVITSIICDEKVCVEFADNGKGIPPEFIDKVFDPDFTTKEKGMGLGLKLAKKFVEAVNGTIRITGSSVNGTQLVLQFPVLKK